MSEHPEMQNLLGPYVMGSLDPREECEVEDHLRECAGCREEANGLTIAHERPRTPPGPGIRHGGTAAEPEGTCRGRDTAPS
jgi:hypothetical protein